MGYNEAKIVANIIHAQFGATLKKEFGATPAIGGIRVSQQGGLSYRLATPINGWNSITILLNWKDLYDVKLVRPVRDENGDLDFEEKVETDVYVDQVVGVIEGMLR